MPGPIQSDAPGLTGFDFNTHAQTSPSAAEGSYRGERVVQIKDQASLLQDAAEELTSQLGEGEEKTLAKRKMGEKARKEGPMIQNVQQALETLGDMDKDEFERILQTLLRMRTSDWRELRKQSQQHLSEPAHEYAALQALLEALQAEGAPAEQIQAAETALQQLAQEQGSAIQAALNISGVAKQFAGAQLGDLQTLRNTYRDAVLDYQDLSQTFGQLIDHYGEPELPQAIQYLVKALGADIAADGSSIDRYKLNAALNDLYRLEVLTGLLEDCDTLVTRNRASGNAFRPSELLKEVLELQQNQWLRPDLIAPLPTKLGVSEISSEINFLREFRELARMIPLKAYSEPEQRPRLLDAIQQAMDTAIEREEEQL